MTQVTKESLEISIKAIEEVKQRFGFISMGQEYNLKAFKLLLSALCAVETAQLYDIAELSRSPYESYRCIEEDEFGDYVKIDDITDALGVEKRCR